MIQRAKAPTIAISLLEPAVAATARHRPATSNRAQCRLLVPCALCLLCGQSLSTHAQPVEMMSTPIASISIFGRSTQGPSWTQGLDATPCLRRLASVAAAASEPSSLRAPPKKLVNRSWTRAEAEEAHRYNTAKRQATHNCEDGHGAYADETPS